MPKKKEKAPPKTACVLLVRQSAARRCVPAASPPCQWRRSAEQCSALQRGRQARRLCNSNAPVPPGLPAATAPCQCTLRHQPAARCTAALCTGPARSAHRHGPARQGRGARTERSSAARRGVCNVQARLLHGLVYRAGEVHRRHGRTRAQRCTSTFGPASARPLRAGLRGCGPREGGGPGQSAGWPSSAGLWALGAAAPPRHQATAESPRIVLVLI